MNRRRSKSPKKKSPKKVGCGKNELVYNPHTNKRKRIQQLQELMNNPHLQEDIGEVLQRYGGTKHHMNELSKVVGCGCKLKKNLPEYKF